MELDSREVLRVLRAKGVTWLRHANTVQTTCTFLKQGHLLARGVVHERKLTQSDQITNTLDRALGVWYDLFFDASDVHAQYKQRNFYGPVLLNFDLALLEKDWLPFVWVTKLNPKHWTTATPSSERWFTSIAELETGYRADNVGQHIVLRNVAGTVRLNPYLREIIVDWTNLCPTGSQQTFTQEAGSALAEAARIGGVSLVNVARRWRSHSANPHCACSSQYRAMKSSTLLKFFAE